MALRTVSVVLVEPVAVFEFSVAVEVFGISRPEEGLADIDFRVCAVEPGRPLRAKSVSPFSVVASHGLDGIVGSDLVIVSPTLIRADEDYPAEILAALRREHAAGATLLSLCSGSFVLGAAGLLDGRRCATHWMYVDEMRRRFPDVEVDGNVLFVDEGDIVTSAGTAAGIDAALHIVRRELGSEAAVKIARRMVVPPQRDGGQQQFVATPLPECRADSLSDLLTWVVDHLADQHTAGSLARRAVMSERTFARRFVAETGTTPHKWLTQQRVLQARRLLEETDLAVEQIADQVGFNSSVVLRDHFRRQVGLAPVDYRRRFTLRSA